MILFGWGARVFGGNIFAGYLADKLPALRVALAALVGGTVLLAISPLMVSDLVVACIWAVIWARPMEWPRWSSNTGC